MSGRGRRGALAALAVTLVLWGSAFPGIRAGLEGYGPGHLALLRFLVASAALAAYAAASRMRVPARRDLPVIALAGVIGIAAYHVSLNAGERTVTAGAASLLAGTVPLLTALLAAACLGERVGARRWAGIGVSSAGVALIAAGEGDGVRVDPGAFLVLLAALAQAVYFVLQKPRLTTYSAPELTAWAIWAGTLALLPFAPGLADAARAAPLRATLAVVYLGLFPGAVAYATWAYALARAPASRTAASLYLVPVVTCVAGWLWLGEVPAPLVFVGGAVSTAGVALAARGADRGPSAHRTPTAGPAGPAAGTDVAAAAPDGPGRAARLAGSCRPE